MNKIHYEDTVKWQAMPIGECNKNTKTITTVKQQALIYKYLDEVYDCVSWISRGEDTNAVK